MSDSRFELTEIGRHMSPQVASVFDYFLDRELYDENIITSISIDYDAKAEYNVEEDPTTVLSS